MPKLPNHSQHSPSDMLCIVTLTLLAFVVILALSLLVAVVVFKVRDDWSHNLAARSTEAEGLLPEQDRSPHYEAVPRDYVTAINSDNMGRPPGYRAETDRVEDYCGRTVRRYSEAVPSHAGGTNRSHSVYEL